MLLLKMPSSVNAPYPCLQVGAEPLTPHAFRPFGTVIANPIPGQPVPNNSDALAALVQGPGLGSENTLRDESAGQVCPVLANQGTALKYENVSTMIDLSARAWSGRPARPVMNLFVCAPRGLEPGTAAVEQGRLPVRILERHPFTTQTFVPLGISPSDESTRYLVIVAPALSLQRTQKPRPPPFPLPEPRSIKPSTDGLGPSRPPPYPTDGPPPAAVESEESDMAGPGLPDLEHARAFVARGSQAVTYGAGTWHAPMMVLGNKPVDFVVVQHANGVASEDCQEVEVVTKNENEGLVAVVPKESQGLWTGRKNLHPKL